MYDLFNFKTLQNLCHTYGLRPSKQYGQNYLIDHTAIETIIAAAELSQNDVVVEVGPGFGVLTLALAPHVKKVIAFEIEKKLAGYWEKIINKEQMTNNIEIVWGNVLRFDPSQPPLKRGGGDDHTPPLFKEGAYGGGRYKVVANLPYQITSPVIRLFLEAENPPKEMILMVQKEVAERICAKAGDMSLLSVAVQYYADAEIVRIVSRTCFWPIPAVDSAVIKIINKEQRIKNKEFDEEFFRIVKTGFAQRRKLLVKNLEPIVGKKNKAQLVNILTDLGLLSTVRAQELSVNQWKELVYKVQSLL